MQRTEERVVYALIVNDDDVTCLIMASFSFFHNFLIPIIIFISTNWKKEKMVGLGLKPKKEREREFKKKTLTFCKNWNEFFSYF